MDKRKEELLQAIRFLLAEYENPNFDERDTEPVPQLVGCKICFLEPNNNEVFKYTFESEFDLDPDSSYIDFM